MSEMTKFVLLKDGSMLECTIRQLERINQLILSSHEFEKFKVKLQERVFTLGELETDPQKIANARQQGLPLKVEPTKFKNTDMG